MMSKIYHSLIAALALISHLSCGLSGGDVVFIDPEPPGNRIHAASFISLQEGITVSGIVAIYQSGSSYTVRLESFSAPSSSPLRLIASSADCEDYIALLKGYQGNQNYFTGLSDCGVWNVVRIRYVGGNPPSNEIAQANFP